MRAKMRADIKKDSMLEGALNAQEKILLNIQHTATKDAVEKKIEIGLYGNIPINP